ncbi:MAG: three-Cys-motif partner protein TcmP [Proteiniphilum sp.]
MAADINKKTFDEKTLLKLDIFRECFREWFPVFLNRTSIERIYIMDMFAGSGTDMDGNPGSPLILLDEVRGTNTSFCSQAEMVGRDIRLCFNEVDQFKADKLNINVSSFIRNCEQNCGLRGCYFGDKIEITSKKFEDIINSEKFIQIASNKKFGKFLVLDQYGFKQIGDNVFERLIEFPSMDFIFFISSSAIRRFRSHESVKKYIDSSKIDFDETNPRLSHQQIANYYRSLVPPNKEYYIHHFSILKGPNRYGLIFGSGHTYGMEKFLTVCWKKDKYAGESDELINDDWEEGTLFAQSELPQKKRMVKEDIQQQILKGIIKDNKTGLKYALQRGCLGDVYCDAVEELLSAGKISIDGSFNRRKTSIHSIKDQYIYKIRVSK